MMLDDELSDPRQSLFFAAGKWALAATVINSCVETLLARRIGVTQGAVSIPLATMVHDGLGMGWMLIAGQIHAAPPWNRVQCVPFFAS